MDGFDVDFADAPEQIGLLLSVGLLKDEPVREFIERVREREGIYPPVDREELEENLRAFPPESFIAESLPVAEKAVEAAMFDGDVDGVDLGGLGGQLPSQAMELVAQSMGFLQEFLRIDSTVSTAARLIARHIVAGPLELPEPLPLSMSAVGKLPLGGEASLLYALIPPYADIEAVTEQIKTEFRRHYAKGERSRWPGKFAETLWLRHYAAETGLDLSEETTYRHLAELALEVWPELRPDAKGDSDEWKRVVERHMERIRKNNKAFEKRKEQGFWKTET